MRSARPAPYAFGMLLSTFCVLLATASLGPARPSFAALKTGGSVRAFNPVVAKRAGLPYDRLRQDLDGIAKGFHGRLGYCVVELRTGRRISYRGDERFPSASTIKTAVMVEAVKQIEEGKLKWTDTIPLPPEADRYASMWAYFLRDGLKVNIDGLVNLTMNVSDNTAAMMLAAKVGPEAIESRMIGFGLPNTKWLSSPPPTNLRLVRLRQTFACMGMTTPNEMARLLTMLYEDKLAAPAACERMRRIMSHQYWDDGIASAAPQDVVVAGKVGALNRSRSDTAIVYGPNPYVLTIYTDNQKDQRWTADNEGDEAVRRISGVVWNALNPQRNYSPPSGYRKWLPTGAGVE